MREPLCLLSWTASACLLLASCATTPPVQGKTWYWLGSLVSLSEIKSPEPEAYTLEFAGERAAIRADCNRGSGSMSPKGDRVSFGPMALTRAFCRPPSQGEAYARQLQSAERLSTADGVLRIELKGGGAMFFAEDPKARLAHYRCREQRMLSALFAGESAHVWFAGAHYTLPRARSASGARYSDGSVTFDTKGVLASLRRGDAVLAQDCQVPS
jgi:membrane-bound inhibitor of C-type lysozyme